MNKQIDFTEGWEKRKEEKRQIEGMARVIYETGEAIEEIDLRYACLHGADSDSETKFMRIARHLYHNDYRKSTDVAREIFEEIEYLIWQYDTHPASDLTAEIAELKKKYESEEK